MRKTRTQSTKKKKASIAKEAKKAFTKQTPQMAVYSDENLFRLIWGNKTEEQVLAEQLKFYEKKNPEFKRILDRAES